MLLRDEALRVKLMLSAYTINWPMQLIDLDTLDSFETGAKNGDQVLTGAVKDLLAHLKRVLQPEDYAAMGAAYEIYEETVSYLLLKSRNLTLLRTPGTGGHGEKRPDFECNHSLGTFYIEVKTLDVQDGWVQHKEIAYEGLDAKAELDGRARTPGVHVGDAVEITAHRAGSSVVDRIETAIKKIKGNAKMDQLRYGPTILLVNLTRLFMDADDPSSLVPHVL